MEAYWVLKKKQKFNWQFLKVSLNQTLRILYFRLTEHNFSVLHFPSSRYKFFSGNKMTNWARFPFFFYSFLVNIYNNISHLIKYEIYTFNLSAHYKAGRRWWAPPRGSPEHSYCLSPWGACSCWSSDWEARLGEQLLTWGWCQLGKEESYNIQWPGIRTSSTLPPSNVPNAIQCCL